jgi:class 3 adenylate cyclase
MEQATRELQRQFLVSSDALERLEGLERYALEDLGLHQLRGRTAAIRLYSATTKP